MMPQAALERRPEPEHRPIGHRFGPHRQDRAGFHECFMHEAADKVVEGKADQHVGDIVSLGFNPRPAGGAG